MSKLIQIKIVNRSKTNNEKLHKYNNLDYMCLNVFMWKSNEIEFEYYFSKWTKSHTYILIFDYIYFYSLFSI